MQCRRPRFDSWVGKIRWRRERLPTPVFLGFPCGLAGKEFACNAGDLGSIPGLGRSPGEGKGYPLRYSGLENFMDAIVHEVAKSRTRLSDFPFTFHFHALEKEMAIHSSIFAWRIPGTGAWWAAVYGVAQSRTRLTLLSSSSISSSAVLSHSVMSNSLRPQGL